MSGLEVVGVPRRNGGLAFDAPWESRAFGIAAAVVATCFDEDWEPFRTRLIAAIAADQTRPYWESWTVALEELLVTTALLSAQDLDDMSASPAGVPAQRT